MMSQEVPTSTELSPEEVEERKAHGLKEFVQMVRTSPGGCLMTLPYKHLASAYYNFKFRSDDIVLMTHMKSGTIWTSEILWAMTNIDQLHLADTQHLNFRRYALPYDMLINQHSGEVFSELVRRLGEQCPGRSIEDGLMLQLAASHPTTTSRLITTTLPFCLHNPSFLNTCKVVYLARNPKDVCNSIYNYLRLTGCLEGDLDNFTELFMAQGIKGSYWQHLRQAWELRHHHNLHFMLYEDMKQDIMTQLKKLKNFLGMDLTLDQLVKVAEHTSLDTMRAREVKMPVCNYATSGSFFPNGRVGSWRHAASPELNAKMDDWITRNSSDMNIPFRYM